MNPRSTGILALVALALAAFVYFYEIGGEKDRREAADREKRLFTGVEAEDIEWIALTTSDAAEVRVERRGDAWSLTEPLEFPADGFAIEGMASNLASATSESVFEEPQPLGEYGLDQESGVVRFGAGGKARGVRFGNKTPVGASSYATVEGMAEVYTVPSHLAGSFRKTLGDLREKRILAFEGDAVTRLQVSWPSGRVVIERESTPATDEADAEGAGLPSPATSPWRLVAPVEGRADDEAVDALISTLSFLRASGFEDDPDEEAQAALTEPAFAAVLTVETEEGESRQVSLAVSPPREGGLLVRGAQTSLFRLPPERLDDLPRELSAYRFKTLANFPATDAQRLEFFFQPDVGDPVAITAVRGEEGWTSEPERMAPGKLPRLVSELARLRAKDIVADELGEDELRAVGLSPPNTIITVLGELPEDAAEGAAAPVLAEIHIGRVEGESILARAAGDPTVYRLGYELAEHVPVSLEAFRNRFGSEEVEPELPPLAEPLEDLLDATEESP